MITEVPESQIENFEAVQIPTGAVPMLKKVGAEVGIRAGEAVLKRLFPPKKKEVPVEVTPTWQKVLPWALGGLGGLLLLIVLLKK